MDPFTTTSNGLGHTATAKESARKDRNPDDLEIRIAFGYETHRGSLALTQAADYI